MFLQFMLLPLLLTLLVQLSDVVLREFDCLFNVCILLT